MGLINYTNIEDNTPATANQINQRFGDVIAQVNGNLDSTNFKTGGIPVSAISSDVYAKMWPIGSVYINATNNANPADLLGFGTWVQFAAGRVIVGIDTDQTEFNAPEKTGGHKALQSHTHTGTTNSTGAHTHALGNYGTSGGSFGTVDSSNASSSGTRNTGSAGNHSHSFTTNSSGTGNAGNLQPYITCYLWKRTG